MGRPRLDARETSLRTVNKLSKDMKKIGTFLVDVVTGKVQDEIEKISKDKDGKEVVEVFRKPASLSVRVSAAKQYKELIIDKLLPDTKADPKRPDGSKTKVMDAIGELEKEIHAAKAERN